MYGLASDRGHCFMQADVPEKLYFLQGGGGGGADFPRQDQEALGETKEESGL